MRWIAYLALFVIVTPLSAMETDILEETRNRLSLQIHIPEPEHYEIHTPAADWSIPAWPDADYAADPATRVIEPVLTIPLAIPGPNSFPLLTVISSEYAPAGDLPTTVPAVVPISDVTDDLALSELDQISFRYLGRMGGHAMGQIVIRPRARRGQVLRDLTLQIDFDVQKNLLVPASPTRLPGINRLQANTWKQSPRRVLERIASHPAGTWYRIPVEQHGVYRISSLSFPEGSPGGDPGTWRVFAPTNQGRELSPDFELEEPTPPNLREISAWAQGLSDGSLESGDGLVFYAEGPQGWYGGEHNTHAFSNEITYWLLVPDDGDAPSRVTSLLSAAGTVDRTLSSYQAAYYHETDLVNLFHSGQRWLGESLSGTSDYLHLIPELSYVASTGTVNLRASFLGTLEAGTGIQHHVSFSLNTTPLNTQQDVFSNTLDITASATANAGVLTDGSNLIRIDYTGNSMNNLLYLDSLLLTYPRRFATDASLMQARIDLEPGITELIFQGVTSTTHFWDITDPGDVRELDINDASFRFAGSGVHLLLGFDEAQIIELPNLTPGPDLSDPVLRNSDLQAEYVIIAPEAFQGEAERVRGLRAERVRAEDRMSALVAPLETIYDEFSGGVTDPMAIKYFLHYAYNNWQAPQVHYVLFLGDADYDYRNITNQSNLQVPTWEIDNLSYINTRATDDPLVYIVGLDQNPDLATGRFPAGSPAEARIMVDKLEEYLLNPEPGSWRNTAILVGDDPWRPHDNEPYHIEQSESFANTLPRSMHIEKVYLTEYPEVQDPNSPYVRKPAARDDLLQKIYDGAVLVNFMGHGSPRVWTQEEVFTQTDLPQVNTGMRLPFWVAGTCDWGLYDDVGTRCVPEDLLVMESNGAVGVLSSTRKSYPLPNFTLFSGYFERLFPADERSETIPVGDALMLAKSEHYNVTNDEKYILLADPAMKLATPRRSGSITSLTPPVIHAMGNVSYTGSTDTTLAAGSRAVVSAYDTPIDVSKPYAWPTAAPPRTVEYVLPGRRIFRGQISVNGDQFNGGFTIPRDIRYSGEGGVLNVQYWDATGLDGVVFLDTLQFAGSDSTQIDAEGPAILFSMLNTALVNGDNLSANEELNIQLEDPQGINLTGVAGHGISLAIDGDWANAQDVTELFEYDLDRTDRGRLGIVLNQITPGEHDIEVKAWDNFNNPNTATIRLIFFAATQFKVFDIYNFPNPMQTETDFTFMLSHPADVAIDLHTLSGRRIRSLYPGLLDQGFNSVHWDGRDSWGNSLSNGVYLYVVKASSLEDNTRDTSVEKLVIAR